MSLPFRMHQGDAFLLESLPQQCVAFGLPPIEPPEVTDWLEPGARVQVGEVSFDLRPAPGHSPGSLIFDFGDQMIVGDVIFQGSIGRTDFPRSEYDALIRSIREVLLPLGDDVTFLPGHGPTSTFGQERVSNPFVTDPDRFRFM